MLRAAALIACGAGLLWLAAPADHGHATAAAGSLELRLEVRDRSGRAAQRFAAGEPVDLVLEIRNAGEQALALEFATARTHDFRVLDSEGREVWSWSHGRLFAQMLTQLELAPGERRRFAASWDQRDASGTLARPGRYGVVATLASSPSPPPVGPVELEVEGAGG